MSRPKWCVLIPSKVPNPYTTAHSKKQHHMHELIVQQHNFEQLTFLHRYIEIMRYTKTGG